MKSKGQNKPSILPKILSRMTSKRPQKAYYRQLLRSMPLLPVFYVRFVWILSDYPRLFNSRISLSQFRLIDSLSIIICRSSCLLSSSKVIVTIKIPIQQSFNRNGLVLVTPLPFAYNGTICSISLPSSYVSQMNSTFIVLNSAQQAHCDPQRSHLCLI